MSANSLSIITVCGCFSLSRAYLNGCLLFTHLISFLFRFPPLARVLLLCMMMLMEGKQHTFFNMEFFEEFNLLFDL